MFVSGGCLEVLPHAITVLADTEIRAKDRDEKAALEARKAAEEAMANKTSKEGDRRRRGVVRDRHRLLEAIRMLRQRSRPEPPAHFRAGQGVRAALRWRAL